MIGGVRWLAPILPLTPYVSYARSDRVGVLQRQALRVSQRSPLPPTPPGRIRDVSLGLGIGRQRLEPLFRLGLELQ
jgi:hypothetical protein